MSAGHDHGAGTQNEKGLWIALGLTGSFLIAEVIGGILAQSLALLSDAAHMFTDVAALAISLAAVRIARRPADRKRSFGYYRFEILAAAFNAMLLFVVAAHILYEAYRRLSEPPEIQSTTMLVIAVFGLAINLLSMRILQGGKEESMNVKGPTSRSGATCWVQLASSLALPSSASPIGHGWIRPWRSASVCGCCRALGFCSRPASTFCSKGCRKKSMSGE